MTKRRIRRARLRKLARERKQRAEPRRKPRLFHIIGRLPDIADDLPEPIRAWNARVDLGAVYGLTPPADDIALANRFVATLDPSADRELAYAAALMAMWHCRTCRETWGAFDPAFFAAAQLGAYFEGTLAEQAAIFAILDAFFLWLAAQGELTERELQTVRLNVRAAEEAIAEATEDGIFFANVVDPRTGEKIGSEVA
jgi:hypothetical protein